MSDLSDIARAPGTASYELRLNDYFPAGHNFVEVTMATNLSDFIKFIKSRKRTPSWPNYD